MVDNGTRVRLQKEERLMIALISDNLEAIRDLCRKHGIE